jgi:hypothetical protein
MGLYVDKQNLQNAVHIVVLTVVTLHCHSVIVTELSKQPLRYHPLPTALFVKNPVRLCGAFYLHIWCM